MKISRNLFVFSLLSLLIVTSCKKDPDPIDEPDPVSGCMDPMAINYNPKAELEDGTCEYADTYVPMKSGNSWHLEDTVNVIIASVPVAVDFVQSNDTTVGEHSYLKQRETITADGFGVVQDALYGYRWVHTGHVFRIDLQDTSATEKLFMGYPLELGSTWQDSKIDPALDVMVISTSLMTVPAGSFINVVGITMTDIGTQQGTTMYFAKDVGLIRADVDFEMQGYTVNIKAELTSYTLN